MTDDTFAKNLIKIYCLLLKKQHSDANILKT